MFAATDTYKIGTRRESGGRGDRDYTYVGVIRHDKTAVIECGHRHANRDDSSRSGGRSARDCIRDVVLGAERAATAEHIAAQIRNRWQALTRGGFQMSRQTIEAAKVDAAADAGRYLAAVEKVRALGASVEMRRTPKPVAPAEPEPVVPLTDAEAAWLFGFDQ